MATWQERCRASGGFPTVFPTPTAKNPNPGGTPGAPACRFIVDGVPKYKDANLTIFEEIDRAAESVRDTIAATAGRAVETRDRVLEATGLNRGALGVLGKALGVPPIVVLGIGLAAGYIVLRATFPPRG